MARFLTRGLIKARLEPVRKPSTLSDAAFKTLGTFLLNPSSWNDSKDSGWVGKKIPGLSDPHFQWVAGGARTITFEALITNDRAEGHTQEGLEHSFACDTKGNTTVVSRFAGIASQIFNIPELSIAEAAEQQGRVDARQLKLDISKKLAFYKSLAYPNAFSSANGVDMPPALLKIHAGSAIGKRASKSTFIVNKVEVQTTKMDPQLRPIEAIVKFTMTELTNRILSSDTHILSDN